MDALEGKAPQLRTALLTLAGVIVVAVTLFRVPLATVFTLGVLLICPLLMVGMHGGGHAGGHATHADESRADREAHSEGGESS